MDKKTSQQSATWRRPGSKSKKRKFRGVLPHQSKADTSHASASAAKLKKSDDTSFDVHIDPTAGYSIIQFLSTLQQYVKCKVCNKDVSFTKYGQRGLGFKICVTCDCGEKYINIVNMADKGNSSTVVAGSGETTAIPSGTPKKAVVSKSAKDADAKPVRPKTSRMVNDAITDLNERGGSSLQAIKKYMVNKYKVDAEQQATFIKKYLKAAVASGILIQTKGKGAAGSFKLGSAKAEVPKSSRGRGRPPSKAKALKPHFSKADASTTKKAAASKKAAGSVAKKTTKKAAVAAVAEKKKVSKGPAAKPPKSKTTKAKSPAKKAKPAAAKPKPAVVETKKVVGRKAVSKK